MKKKYWSGRVTRESNALDLERGVFTLSSPRRLALSLKRSAEASDRRKKVLEQAKLELRRIFKRD